MAEREREFGELSLDIDPRYGFVGAGTYVTPSFPAGLIYNLQNQEQQQRVEDDAAAEAAGIREANIAWENRKFPLGPIVKPKFETLRGYKYVLRDGGGINEIEFSPLLYNNFDAIILKKCGADRLGRPTGAAFNPGSKHYDDLAPLRRNIAVLRNYLMVTMFPDGVYSPKGATPDNKEDALHNAQITRMAERLGEALSGGGAMLQRTLNTVERAALLEDPTVPYVSPFMKAANVPDQGITIMYNFLYGLKNNPPVTEWLSLFTRNSPADWPLAPLDKTPFSAENLEAYSKPAIMAATVQSFDELVVQLQTVEDMPQTQKKISVEHARDILRNLRIIFSDSAEESKLNRVTDPKQAEMRMLLGAAMAFRETLARAGLDQKMLQDNPLLEKAVDALGCVSYRVKIETVLALREAGDEKSAALMKMRIQQTPTQQKREMPLREIMEHLERGLNEAARLEQIALVRSVAIHKSIGRQEAMPATSTPRQTVGLDVAKMPAADVADPQRMAESGAPGQYADEIRRRRNPRAPVLTPAK